jgi:hypothetical protein
VTLEDRLRAAAADAFPPTPDLARSWAGKVTAEVPLTAQRRRGRGVAKAHAAHHVPAGALAAKALWPEHIALRHVQTLPSLPATSDLGREVASIDEASQQAGFTVESPGPPSSIHVTRSDIVTLAVGDVVLTEVPARQNDPEILVKTLGPDTHVEPADVDGAPGFFLTGAPHAVAYLSPQGGFEELRPRLAGTTLAFERDGLVIRIEGKGLTLARALRLARATGPRPSP